MRILQVTPYYFPELKFGGPPQKIHALSRGLSRLGFDVHVVTFKSEHPLRAGDAMVEGILVHYLPWIGNGTWQIPVGWKQMRRAIIEADAVHCYGLYNLLCPLAALSARKQARPFIIEPLGMYLPRARSLLLKRVYHQMFTRKLFRHAAR